MGSPKRITSWARDRLPAAVLLAVAASLPAAALAQRGDVFSSSGGRGAPGGDVFSSDGGGNRYGGPHPSRRTGKQAIQDDSIYCQQTPDGQVIPKPYGGTRRNIPCGPNFVQRPAPKKEPPAKPCRCAPGEEAPAQRAASRDLPAATARSQGTARSTGTPCACPQRRVVFHFYYVNGINTPLEGPGRGNYRWDWRLIRANLLGLAEPIGAVDAEPREQPLTIRIPSVEDRFDAETYNPSGYNKGSRLCTDAQARLGLNPALAKGAELLCNDWRGGRLFPWQAGLAPGDLLECLAQTLEDKPDMSREPIPKVVSQIVAQFEAENRSSAPQRPINFFIVIGHSQGNFFVEGVAKALSLRKDRDRLFAKRVGVLALASPSNYRSLDARWVSRALKPFTRADDGIVALRDPLVSARRPFVPNLPPLWNWPTETMREYLRWLAWDPLGSGPSVNRGVRSPLGEAMGWAVPQGCKPRESPACDPGLYSAFINSHLLENYLADPPFTLEGKPIPKEVGEALRYVRSPPPGAPVLADIRKGVRELKCTLLKGEPVTAAMAC